MPHPSQARRAAAQSPQVSGDTTSNDTARQLRKALAALQMATAALQQQSIKSAQTECENRVLRAEVVRLNTTILHQDEELAQWERGERAAIESAPTLQQAPRTTVRSACKPDADPGDRIPLLVPLLMGGKPFVLPTFAPGALELN